MLTVKQRVSTNCKSMSGKIKRSIGLTLRSKTCSEAAIAVVLEEIPVRNIEQYYPDPPSGGVTTGRRMKNPLFKIERCPIPRPRSRSVVRSNCHSPNGTQSREDFCIAYS